MNYRSFTFTVIAILCLRSSVPSAEIQVTQIGTPVFKPADFTPFAIDQSTDLLDTWKAILPEPHHMHIGNTKLPGEPHPGPYDNELIEGVAAAGHLVTDVFTVDEFTSGWTIYTYSLVPDLNAPEGRSPDFDNGPVIPNEIFPIEVTVDVLSNGNSIGGSYQYLLESLSSYGKVTFDNGHKTDFTELNWSHIDFFSFVNASGSRVEDAPVGEYAWEIRMQDENGDGWDFRLPFSVVDGPSEVLGDLNHDGQIDIGDVNILTRNISAGGTNQKLDMNDDQQVTSDDLSAWITRIARTWIGDANLDGEFTSLDFVQVFQAGKYESNDVAGWSEGDWNLDQRFDSGDFVAAFQDGGYEIGPRVSVNAVPEPSGIVLLVSGVIGIGRLRKRL